MARFSKVDEFKDLVRVICLQDWGYFHFARIVGPDSALYLKTFDLEKGFPGQQNLISTPVFRRASRVSVKILEKFIRMTGAYLEEKKLTQEDAELLLDLLYAELGKRLEKRK